VCLDLLSNDKVIEQFSDNIKFGKRIQRDTDTFDCFMEEFKIWVEETKGIPFPVLTESFE